MFNLSGSEMIFLLLIALVVLGPEKLPEAVRKFGKAYGEFKKMTTGFQSELRSALDEPMKEMRETADQLRKSANLDFNFEPDRVDGDTGQPAAAPAAVETSTTDAATAVAATDAVATDAVATDAVATDAVATDDGTPPVAVSADAANVASDASTPLVDVSAFGLASSAPALSDVDISDVNTTDVASSPATGPTPAPDDGASAVPARPALAPNGWSPVAPTRAAPTPSGWSPVASNDVVASSTDEVAPG